MKTLGGVSSKGEVVLIAVWVQYFIFCQVRPLLPAKLYQCHD